MSIASTAICSATVRTATKALGTATATATARVAFRPFYPLPFAAVRCRSTASSPVNEMHAPTASTTPSPSLVAKHLSNSLVSLATPSTTMTHTALLPRRRFLASSSDNNDPKASAADSKGTEYDDYTVPIVIEMPPMDDVGGDESHCFVETWHKAEGDLVHPEDVLCDISTPDFVFGMQIDDAEVGLLKEVHVSEGVKVPDRTPLCTIYHKPPKNEDERDPAGNDNDDDQSGTKL